MTRRLAKKVIAEDAAAAARDLAQRMFSEAQQFGGPLIPREHLSFVKTDSEGYTKFWTLPPIQAKHASGDISRQLGRHRALEFVATAPQPFTPRQGVMADMVDRILMGQLSALERKDACKRGNHMVMAAFWETIVRFACLGARHSIIEKWGAIRDEEDAAAIKRWDAEMAEWQKQCDTARSEAAKNAAATRKRNRVKKAKRS